MFVDFIFYSCFPSLHPHITCRHYGDCKVQCNSIYIETILFVLYSNRFDEILSAFVALPMNRNKPIGHPNTNKTFWLQIGPQSETKLNVEFRFNPFSGFQFLKWLFFIRIIFHLFSESIHCRLHTCTLYINQFHQPHIQMYNSF